MKAVLFDLGHTLIDYYCDWRGPEAACVEGVYKILGGRAGDRDAFAQHLGGALALARRAKEERMEEVPLTELLSRSLERYGGLDEDEMDDCLEVFYSALSAERSLVPGARELLSGIKERGLMIGLVSDVAWGLPSQYPMRDIEHFRLAEFFDDMVFSTDVGLRKPHPKMFKVALCNLGVAPSEAVFVGNSLKQDIAGARKVGMRAVLRRSCFRTESDVTPDFTVDRLDEVAALIGQS